MSAEPVDDLRALPGIPAEARVFYESLLAEPLCTAESLRGETVGYLEHVKEVAAAGEFVDVDSAVALADRSLRLLKTLTEGTSERQHRLVQVAVRYFVLEEDGEGDLTSVTGFDDDVEVMNAIVRHLGRSDLVIELA